MFSPDELQVIHLLCVKADPMNLMPGIQSIKKKVEDHFAQVRSEPVTTPEEVPDAAPAQ